MHKVIQGSLNCGSYWQAVLRFGLPWAFLSRLISYGFFRIHHDHDGSKYLPYPWPYVLMEDLAIMLIVSALWWGFVREIASWKRKG
jgi:hypothetical protein